MADPPVRSVSVRPLGPDDWALLRGLRLAALRDSPGAFLSTYAQARGRTEADWRGWPSHGRAYAAFLDGEPVGMVAVAAGPTAELAELFAMWVVPAARGTGIADALVRAALAWAVGRGYVGVTLEVAAGNERAERLYARHGFRPHGAPTQIGCGLAMRRDLASRTGAP